MPLYISAKNITMKKIIVSLAAVIVVVLFFSASKEKYEAKYPKGKKQKYGVFTGIPAGILKYGEVEKQMDKFSMWSTEVTNKQYRKFLNDLLEKGKTEAYKKAKIDSTGWLKHLPDYGLAKTMTEKYHRDKMYDNFPVVNISREGAELYCKWLSDKLENMVASRNITSNYIFRLPTKEEWMYAAMGGCENAHTPWCSPSVCNTKGGYLANFVIDSLIRTICGNARFKTEKARVAYFEKHPANVSVQTYIAPAVSFYPNQYGLYNMLGNVAEMVAEETGTKGSSWHTTAEHIWIQAATDPYKGITEPTPFIGFRPVLVKLKTDDAEN